METFFLLEIRNIISILTCQILRPGMFLLLSVEHDSPPVTRDYILLYFVRYLSSEGGWVCLVAFRIGKDNFIQTIYIKYTTELKVTGWK